MLYKQVWKTAGLFPAILGKGPWPKLGKNDQLNMEIGRNMWSAQKFQYCSYCSQATVENSEDPNQLADLDSRCFQDRKYLG